MVEASHDVGLFNFIARLFIYLAIANAVASLFVELMKADFFPLGRSREKLDRAEDEG